MPAVAASSPEALVLTTPPSGSSAPVSLGKATFHFLQYPLTFKTWEFVAIAWLVFYLSRHWGKFVNSL